MLFLWIFRKYWRTEVLDAFYWSLFLNHIYIFRTACSFYRGITWKDQTFLYLYIFCCKMSLFGEEKHMSLFCFIYWYYSLNSNCVTDCDSNIFLFKSNKIKYYQRKSGIRQQKERKTGSEVFVLEILIAFVILFCDVVSCLVTHECLFRSYFNIKTGTKKFCD